MIWSHVFNLLGSLVGWLGDKLPTSGCEYASNFVGLDIGYLANYIDLVPVTALFALMVTFELAMFGVRLAVGIYKLLPLSGGGG